jgi:hypothetical protein
MEWMLDWRRWWERRGGRGRDGGRGWVVRDGECDVVVSWAVWYSSGLWHNMGNGVEMLPDDVDVEPRTETTPVQDSDFSSALMFPTSVVVGSCSETLLHSFSILKLGFSSRLFAPYGRNTSTLSLLSIAVCRSKSACLWNLRRRWTKDAIPARITMRMTPRAIAESRSIFDSLRRAGCST